jgi:hypothetical protein
MRVRLTAAASDAEAMSTGDLDVQDAPHASAPLTDDVPDRWSEFVVVKPRTSSSERAILILYLGGTLGMKPNAEGSFVQPPGREPPDHGSQER